MLLKWMFILKKAYLLKSTAFEEKVMTKLISWNVNGLRPYKQGIFRLFKKADADIFCIQESKVQPGQIELELDGYHHTGIMLRGKDIPVLRCLPV